MIVSSGGEFLGVDAESTLATAYNDIVQNTQENLYALSEATTDELFIPTRGTDWGDNGVWRDLAKHTWTSAHLYNYRTWNFLNGNVYRTNQILHEKTTKTPLQAAEAKFIRAYNMFWIVDLWRQVPFRDADEGVNVIPRVMTVQEAFDLIVKDLEEALPILPATQAGEIAAQNRASKASAHFLLAKLFLNKHVYLGGTPQAADMTRVIEEVDAIRDDGYTLHDGFFEIFRNTADSETILWTNNEYANRIWGSLHYGQGRETAHQGGGWNGFATTADFYNKFEGNPNENYGEAGDEDASGQEERRGYVPENSVGIGFLIGIQGGPDGPVKARSGDDLNFTKEVNALTGQPDYTGIRLLKYHPTINTNNDIWGRHLIAMRYADAHLMKIEAILRGGTSSDNAQDLLDELRTIRHTSTTKTATLDEILDERGRELYIEGWRRNDLVRYGRFAAQFGFVEDTGENRNVFPIPDNALGSNPNLKQNDGY